MQNISAATSLTELEAQLSALRSAAQAQLLSAHALERQWRQKQREMDHALGPFSPSELYLRLGRGVREQDEVCRAMEESFVGGNWNGGGPAGGSGGSAGGSGAMADEREVLDWLRRYVDCRRVYYLRLERKNRWDEGRVGGWR